MATGNVGSVVKCLVPVTLEHEPHPKTGFARLKMTTCPGQVRVRDGAVHLSNLSLPGTRESQTSAWIICSSRYSECDSKPGNEETGTHQK